MLAGLAVVACKDDEKQVTPATNNVELTATISASQQVPVNTTTGTGTFTGTFNRDTKLLTYKVDFAGLAAPISGAHIHLGSPGRNGGVKVNFSATAATVSPINGSIKLDQPLDLPTIDSLLANRTYVNIHTTAFPLGAIRGNIRVK